MAEALVNGVRLAWQQMGEGPDLVFVHGLAASRAFWFGAYALPLMNRFRITLFDLRGHGYSEMTASGYSATAMAEDLRALLDHLDIAHCALVGHSYGGGVALEFAAQHPQRIDALCVMDTKINAIQPYQRLADMPWLSPFQKEVQQYSNIDWDAETQLGLRYLEVVARLRVEDAPLSWAESGTPFGEGRAAMRGAKAWLKLIEMPGVQDEFLAPGASLDRLQSGLQGVPLQLMYASLSRCLPSCERLSQKLPQAQVEILDNCGHFFPLSHAERVRPSLLHFLDSQLAARS